MIIHEGPHSVYLHKDADGVVLYVGCTMHLKSRNAEHRRTSYWWPQVAETEVDSIRDGYDIAHVRECELIFEHEPEFNVQNNPRVWREREEWSRARRAEGWGARRSQQAALSETNAA